ncbi:hypothetical protein KAH27_08180 [bacterium]|nr:hypothetical protein [bacterium]
MKTTKLFNLSLSLIFLALLTFTQKATATANLQGLNSRYLIWHRFNEVPPVDSIAFEVTNLGEYVISPYPFDYDDALSLSNTEFAVFQYDVSDLDSKGWYILQIDGDYKVEMSSDNAAWTTVLEASEVARWADKAKCASPYYIDLQPFLSEDTLYVKISDNNLSPSDNVFAYNALITENGYPCAYGGDQDPTTASGGRYPGDVQFLFIKNNCGTAGGSSRFADGNYPGINGSSNYFVYKFDLPDDNDDCLLNMYIANEYAFQISTNWAMSANGTDFADILYETNGSAVGAQFKLTVNLKSILEQSADNLIYVKMYDSDPTTGLGGMVKRFWISPQVPTGNIIFDPSGEEEIPFLADVSDGCGYHVTAHFWFADLANHVEYRLNLGNDVTDYSHIIINTSSGYLWQGSSNGIDWVDLFISPDKTTPSQQITIHPLTGQLDGLGAQANPGNIMNPYYEGFSNVFFLKVSNIDPTTGWGGQMQKMQINLTPPPPAPAINTIYPVWHYFDATTAFPSERMSSSFYIFENIANQTLGGVGGPNRGISTDARYGSFVDSTANATYKYPIDIDCTQAWYIIQMQNQYSVELSNDGTTWSTAFKPDDSLLHAPAPGGPANLNWGDKGITNMSPYYFDLSSLLPSPTTAIYVRIADAQTDNGWGTFAWNALITKLGYPCFLAGGNEPDTSGLVGDQQWLFTKNGTSDREDFGRFADGIQTFSYKFDLPNDADDLTMHARISGLEFLVGISTNYEMCFPSSTNGYAFTDADIVISNTVPYTNDMLYLNVDLSTLMAETDDNLIYVYFADTTPSNGYGPNVADFWIGKNLTLTQALVNAAAEEEIPFLWQNTYSQVDTPLTGSASRQVLNAASFIYIFNITNIEDAIAYNFEVGGEYAIDVSTNNADWANIFSATTNEAKTTVSYNPYTGSATGAGAAPSNVPGFYMTGDTANQIYFRFSDAIAGDTVNGSVYKAYTEDAIPEPGLVFGLLLVLAALIKRRIKE